MNTKHEQHQVQHPVTGEFIGVDRDLAFLLARMWQYGVTTKFSCQGDPYFTDQNHYEAKRYRAYIMMENNERAMDFIAHVVCGFAPLQFQKASWDITWENDPRDGKSRIIIRFPHKDILSLELFVRELNDMNSECPYGPRI